MALVLLNLILSVVVLSRVWHPKHKAQVRVVFNEIKTTFDENLGDDYLFSPNEYRRMHAAFIGVMQADTLMEQTVFKFNLADHYGFAPDQAERAKKAAGVLRRNILYDLEDLQLTLSLTDSDPNMAEEVLLDVVEKVETYFALQINENHSITLDRAERKLEILTGKLADLRPNAAPGDQLTESMIDLYQSKQAQAMELEVLIRQLKADQQRPRYRPYRIANLGVADVSFHPLALLFLAVFGILLGIAFMIQIAYFIHRISTLQPPVEDAAVPD